MQARASRSCRDQISRGGQPPGLSGETHEPFSYQEMAVEPRSDRTSGALAPTSGSSLDVAGRQSALFQILLVVVLGGMERHCRHDLGHDRLLEAARLLQLLFGQLGFAFLLRSVKEDRGTVLRSVVGPWRLSWVGSWFSQNTSSNFS